MENKQPKEFYKLSINDDYYTPECAVLPLLEFLEPFREKTIWTPFDKQDSEYVKVFTKYGYNVIYSHIEYGQDFYTYEPEHFDLCISNPPFGNKRYIFERLLSFNKPFAMLMTLTWFNDSAPKKLFKDKDLQLLMFEERIKFKNADKGKINFSSAYYCYNFLPKQIIMRSLKENKRQLKLF